MGRLTYQFELIQAIRIFFNKQGFTDVMTPPAVENPGMETHIHPYQLYKTKSRTLDSKYLHTSPEFCMKEILANKDEDLDTIFTITYCFRDEPKSEIHRDQFLMLEWYRKNSFYTDIMNDCENLIRFIQSELKTKKQINDFQRVTIADLFQESLQFNILDFLDTKDLKEKIQKDFKTVILPHEDCSWDDYYFLLFLNLIEPDLKNYPYLLLYEFPAPLAALSTIKKSDARVCERFEVYLQGIELCNAFNELTDVAVLQKRFDEQAKTKKGIYNYELQPPKRFMQVMKDGYPKSSGVALGVERLLRVMQELENPFYR